MSKKQTVSEWIRENYQQHGRAFVVGGRLRCNDEVGHNYNEQNWNREVRRQINSLNGDSEEIPEEGFHVQTVEDALKYHDINEETFDIKKVTVNTWGGPQNPNQQVKLELGKNIAEFNIEKWAEAFKRAIDLPPVKAKPRHEVKSKLTAIISVPDMHIGQLIWKESIGTHGSDYTPETAAKLYVDSVTNLVAGLDGRGIKKFILPFGEDFFNSDNEQGTTTKGTPQVNADPHHMISVGLAAVFQVIDFLQEKGNVHIPVVPGNHDTMLSFMAGIAIEQRYRNNKRVTVDVTPTPSKVVSDGNWGVMFVHGVGKAKDILWQFPTEYPEVWATTKFRDIYCGHVHHTSGEEEQMVRLFFLSSLCPKDAWHNKKMYNAIRQAELNIYHADYGKYETRFFRPYF